MMNTANVFRNEKVDRLIEDLNRKVLRMDRLMRRLPTTDIHILGELDRLSRDISRLVSEDPGKERGSMLLEQARRKAIYQLDRYRDRAYSGMLRHG